MPYISQQRRGIGPHLSHTSNLVSSRSLRKGQSEKEVKDSKERNKVYFFACASILCLEISHIWE